MKIVRNTLACLFAALSILAHGAAASERHQPAGQAPKAMPAQPASQTRTLARSSNAFAADLWKRLATTRGNLAISPASIASALTMLCGGAGGKTDRQIRTVLHIDGDARRAGEQWGQLIARMQDASRQLTLRVANRLFGERSFVFEQSYLDWTNSAFGAALEPVSFRTAAQASRDRINAWVEGQTERRIRELLSPDALDADTRLVLINAIYFRAPWQMPFFKNATSPAPFFAAPAREIDVAMMHNADMYRVAQAAGVKVLELVYDRDASMLVVLPDHADGLAGIESAISVATIEQWMRALDVDSRSVSVSLPRFKIDPSSSLALGDDLKALGMPIAFDVGADFSGIAKPTRSEGGLILAKAFHKAFVSVDEQGTEAAASTGLQTILVGGRPMPMLEFTADHPFLFLIVDRPSRMVLFIGRVSEPSPADDAVR
jgi:serpin B